MLEPSRVLRKIQFFLFSATELSRNLLSSQNLQAAVFPAAPVALWLCSGAVLRSSGLLSRSYILEADAKAKLRRQLLTAKDVAGQPRGGTKPKRKDVRTVRSFLKRVVSKRCMSPPGRSWKGDPEVPAGHSAPDCCRQCLQAKPRAAKRRPRKCLL